MDMETFKGGKIGVLGMNSKKKKDDKKLTDKQKRQKLVGSIGITSIVILSILANFFTNILKWFVYLVVLIIILTLLFYFLS